MATFSTRSRRLSRRPSRRRKGRASASSSVPRAARSLGALLILIALAASAGAEEAVSDLDLEEAIRLGQERNLGLKSSRAALEASTWEKRGSYLAYLPTGSLSSSVTRVDDNSFEQANQIQQNLPPEWEVDPFLYKDTYRTGITVNQEFPLNLHLLGGSKLARAAESAAREGFTADRDALVLGVRSAYFQLLAARDLLRVAEEGVASAENRNLLAAEREELGLIGRSERLRWEVALAEARSLLAAARNGAVLAEMALNQLLHQDLATGLTLAPVDEAAVAWGRDLSEMDPETLAGLVIERSPGASALKAANRAAGAGKTLAFSGLVPSLHFSFSYGWRENDTAALDDYESWSATALLNVPLLDLGKGAAQYRQAAAEKRKSDYETADALGGLRMAVHAAWHEAARARENRVHRETAERQARETFDLMADRYELGHISEFDFVDVQTALTAAQAEAVSARYDYFTALATLESLVGGGNRNSDR